jgi:hypothetical protein
MHDFNTLHAPRSRGSQPRSSPGVLYQLGLREIRRDRVPIPPGLLQIRERLHILIGYALIVSQEPKGAEERQYIEDAIEFRNCGGNVCSPSFLVLLLEYPHGFIGSRDVLLTNEGILA